MGRPWSRSCTRPARILPRWKPDRAVFRRKLLQFQELHTEFDHDLVLNRVSGLWIPVGQAGPELDVVPRPVGQDERRRRVRFGHETPEQS